MYLNGEALVGEGNESRSRRPDKIYRYNYKQQRWP